MNEWESIKKPRLDSCPDRDLAPTSPQQLPFSAFLSKSFRQNEKHPILSDKKLIIYDLKGKDIFIFVTKKKSKRNLNFVLSS